MLSIITGILSSTLGLLWNKARDATAKSLKDGDVTDAKIREIVVRELSDIKTTLDGLSRKDLMSSYISLKEGVQLLNDCLDKSNDEHKAVAIEENDDSVTSFTIPNGGNTLNDVLQLSEAIGKLKIESHHFEAAKERFKDARKKATDAFCNEGLNIQDRIFAAKLRVVSEILECLDSPDTAVTSCLLFLQQLHDLPAVREIFSVYLHRGFKPILEKTESVENVKSIMMINYVLCQFVQKFSSKYYWEFNWPIIQFDDRSFNPIWHWEEVSKRRYWRDELKTSPNGVRVDERITEKHMSAVNSRGEIVVKQNDGVRIISTTGETKSVSRVLWSEDESTNKIKQETVGIAVDEENSVYLIVLYYEENEEENEEEFEVDHVVLCVTDEHCNSVKHKSKLNFLADLENPYVPMAVNQNKDVVMIGHDSMYVCDVTGQLKYKFKPKCYPDYIASSEKNDIIIAHRLNETVEIYSEEGNLKKTIKLPARHQVWGVAFHFVTCKIIALSIYMEDFSFYLHCYSETGERHTSTCLGEDTCHGFPKTTSHPSGPAAIIKARTIFYL